MRLRAIQSVLEQCQPPVSGLGIGNARSPEGKQLITYGNVTPYKAALRQLLPVPGLGSQAKHILDDATFRGSLDQVSVYEDDPARAFQSSVRQLQTNLATMRTAIDALVPDKDGPTHFAVELPELTDPRSLADVLTSLQDFLDLFTGFPVGAGDETMTPVKLSALDVGTNWALLLAETRDALALLAGVIFAAHQMFLYRIEQQKQLALVKAAGDDTADLLKHLKKLRQLQRRLIAEDLAKDKASKASPEQINRLAAIIAHCEKVLRERGVTFAPSLASPKDIQALFPKPADLAPAIAQLNADEDAKLLGDGEGAKLLGPGEPDPGPERK